MFTRLLKTFCLLAVLAVFAAALPGTLRAEDAAPAAAPAKAVAKKTVAHTSSKKTVVHKSKAKTVAKKSTVKTAAAKAVTKPAVAQPEVSLSAVPAVETPTMEVAAVHTRSMADMANPPARSGGPASQVVRQFYDQLTETMKQGDRLGFSGRYAKLQTAMERSFNLDEMMRTAAGPSWTEATPQQQKQLVSAFHNFSISNYANRFPRYDGEQFEVLGEKPGASAGETIVETHLTSGADKTDLNYLVRGGKIVDVYVNGTISEMATRRSEFGSVLRRDGADALLQLLKQKSTELSNS